jgi:hypothetical protein
MESTYRIFPGNHCAATAARCHCVRRHLTGTATAIALLGAGGLLPAQTPIMIPNGSFEVPAVGEPLFASPDIGSWEKTAEPPGYDTNLFGSWDEKSGVFFNLPNPEIIDNVDGFQLAFLFTFPGVGFFQDFNSVGGTNPTPSQEFDVRYEAGRSYRLAAGFTTSTSFPLMEGSTLKMILYYREGASNRVTVAETTVTYSTNVFTDPFHLLDYQVSVPTVDAGDAWAGEHIGIEFVSTTDISMASGIWDIDNVRLIEFVSPALTQPGKSGDSFELTLFSDPGAVVEVLASPTVSLAISNWTSLGTITNVSGITNVQDTGAAGDRRFYTARQLP